MRHISVARVENVGLENTVPDRQGFENAGLSNVMYHFLISEHADKDSYHSRTR